MAVNNSELSFPIKLNAIVLDCRDVAALSDFYVQMLGWKRTYDEGDEWADIASPSGGVNISFQKNEDYVPPVWPEEPGAQQQMEHLDFVVDSKEQLDLAVLHAVSLGAVKAGVQYFEDNCITLFDPEGHPFCFVVGQG